MKICSRIGLLNCCNFIHFLVHLYFTFLSVFFCSCAIQDVLYGDVFHIEAKCIHDQLDFNIKGNSPQSYERTLTQEDGLPLSNPTTDHSANKYDASIGYISNYGYYTYSESTQSTNKHGIINSSEDESENKITKEVFVTDSRPIHSRSIKVVATGKPRNAKSFTTAEIRKDEQKRSISYKNAESQDDIYIEDENYKVTLNSSKTLTYQPIRLFIWYDYEHIFHNSTVEYERLKEGIDRAVEQIHNLFSVIPIQGNLLLQRFGVCGVHWVNIATNKSDISNNKCHSISLKYEGEVCLDGFKIPDNHLEGFFLYSSSFELPEVHFKNGTGLPDTDTVIYVTSTNTDKCLGEGAIAYATVCQADQHFRPIAGYANFCPNYLSSDDFDPEKFYLTVLHEFFHVLGFSQRHFNHFQICQIKRQQSDATSSGNETTDALSCQPRLPVTERNETDGTLQLVTPAVSRESRRHFNCSTIRGPLENSAEKAGSSHWESRFMQPSIMTATLGLPHLIVLDRITLAAFEDTGWYKVNMSLASDMSWGKGAGCNFGTNNYCRSGNNSFFCTGSSLAKGCHYLHLDKGVCKTNKFLDTCKIYQAEKGGECWDSAHKINKADLWKGEAYNINSRCFISNLSPKETIFHSNDGRTKRDVIVGEEEEGRCYEHRCNDTTTLEVRVSGSDWKLCRSRQRIKLSNYDGYIVCPSSSLMCSPVTSRLALTKTGTVVCVRLNISFHGLSKFIVSPLPQDVTREMRLNELSKQLAEKLDAIVTGNGTSVSGSPYFHGDAVCFNLKTKRSNRKACTQAVVRLRAVVSKNTLDVVVEKQKFTAKLISYRYTLRPCQIPGQEGYDYKTASFDPMFPKDERPSSKRGILPGIVAAVTIGAVCVVVFASVGILLYWKTMIPRAVGPVNGSVPEISYHTNRQESPASVSENGSVGQIEFIQ